MSEKSKVPRPPNAFMIFGQQYRKILADKNPNCTNKQISKILGTEWRNMCKEEKTRYHRLADEAYQQHLTKYPGYYYSPLEARQKKAARKRLSQMKGDKGSRGSKEAKVEVEVAEPNPTINNPSNIHQIYHQHLHNMHHCRMFLHHPHCQLHNKFLQKLPLLSANHITQFRPVLNAQIPAKSSATQTISNQDHTYSHQHSNITSTFTPTASQTFHNEGPMYSLNTLCNTSANEVAFMSTSAFLPPMINPLTFVTQVPEENPSRKAKEESDLRSFVVSGRNNDPVVIIETGPRVLVKQEPAYGNDSQEPINLVQKTYEVESD